ncbi:MAG: sigma-70 family RNA polymerase sigma factor [Phycicoccus sp.]|mgnify:CR=1 FL=1|nr:sigma-70 family RNA polymerase sigma factor [Phycicoccus sp.]
MTVEDLVRLHGQTLFRLAVMLTGTAADGEDLLQTTLMRLLRSPAGLARADQPWRYARRALVNEYVSAARRPWRREHPVAAVPDVGRDDTVAPEDEGWRLLATLPRRQRAVLALRYYEHLADDEIADVLHISASTVRSNAARGLATLRTTLTPTKKV